jgi:hypothetical protein
VDREVSSESRSGERSERWGPVVPGLRPLVAGALIGAVSVAVPAEAELDEWKIKREEVFGFAQEPVVTREGDLVTVRFESRGLCDVSVAIEDAGGGIVRHVVSEVLGAKAPEPLTKNSKRQDVRHSQERGVFTRREMGVPRRLQGGLQGSARSQLPPLRDQA